LRKDKEIQGREEKLKAEKKLEFIKDLHVERQKVFTEQNLKSERRRKEIEETKPKDEVEVPATQSAEEEPSEAGDAEEGKPKAKKSPKKKAGAKGEAKKAPKEPKKAEGVIIEGVEGRMRAEMQKQRELAALEQIRLQKFEDKKKKGELKEAGKAQVLRNQKRQEEEKARAAKDQKAVIKTQAREEAEKENERKHKEVERKENLRNENIQKKVFSRMSTADCGSAFRKKEPVAEEEEEEVAAEAS
jgi:hypothetical protein